jgi:hypothetical protein
MADTVVPCNGTPPTPQPLRIDPEAPDAINVGAGGKLIVPREDLDDGLDDGTELDLVGAQSCRVRKPDRREWILLKRDSELTTRLLLHKPNPDGIEVEYYFVDRKLRDPIRDELKDVRVFLYYSPTRKTFGLWVVNVSPGNSWYESLHQLFSRPGDFFAGNLVRVMSDKPTSRYRVKHKPAAATEVAWPETPIAELLGEALGKDHFITSREHPVYRDLVEGTELA